MRHKTENTVGEQRFEIVRPLGSGGFGAVYEAIDGESGRHVALKELTRVGPSALFRFKQEFRALSDVHHPNLVSIQELIEQEGRWYIVMELVEGEDLLGFVRPDPCPSGFDEERLRQAFVGVAQGLEALHAYGILHRDLKPSNVRVTAEGRAVLLDFGLATSVESADQSTNMPGVGTLLYMAPEQLEGKRLGRSADWYSFGACLYQALTGRLPYEGGVPTLVAFDKTHREAAHPSTYAADLPEHIAALSLSLLQINAELRPSGVDVLRTLQGAPFISPLALTALPMASLAPQRVFAGREAEIEHLERALARTDEGMLRIVLVEGESGVGKSELAAEFLRQQQARDPRTLTLRARCYENEQVSYKAFDGCIDDLSPVLKRMGAAADALMPPDAALLAQLFPVLADVPAIVRAKSGDLAADPAARRLQAFAALAKLFTQLAEEHPLILLIDDLQWADAESFRLLRALVEDPHKPPILVIATVRPRDELEPAILAQLELVRAFQCVDVIPIMGLPRPRAEELAHLLLGPGSDPKWASVIALESRGHPLFLSELIHFSKSRDLSANGTLTLEAALKARIERLPKQACALLELVAIAGRPHQVKLFADALEVENLGETVSVLLGAKLLRVRRDRDLVCFHDRIRQVTLSLIASGRLPHLHRKLAVALERDLDADPTEQAAHWDLATETEQALNAYERAADQALDSLAFAQAERLYARALALLGSQRDERYALLTVARAHAVACAGRSAEAAVLYQRAAGLATGEEQRLRLRSKTAQQLILSGDVSGGLAVCRQLFAELGISLPHSDLAALLRAVWDRLCLWLSGYAQKNVRLSVDEGKKRLVLELLHELMKALGILKTSAFLALSGQHARRALALADPTHVASALANEGWLHSTQRGGRAGEPFFARSRALSLQVGDPAVKALLAQQEGSSRVANWDWSGGSILLEQAEQLYRKHVAHDPWSLTVTRYLLGLAWYRLGEHARLAEQMDLWIGEAHERNDRVAVALLSGMGNGSVRHLMRGVPQEALRELDEAVAAVPSEPFSFAHLGHLVGTQLALLNLDARDARDWFERRQKQLSKPLLLRSRFGKEALTLLRTNAALRACEVAGASERKAILAEVQKTASGLAHKPTPFTRAFAAHFQAQVEALEGATERALVSARAARQGFERVHYMGAHAASYLEGTLEGGQAGSQKCDAALGFFRAQGWREPEQALVMMLPALPALAQARSAPVASRRKCILHYEVLGPLGSGGFGTVCEARDVHTGRSVALKELVSTSARSLERFKHEFRALHGVHHPNLVRIDALIEDQGTWYIVMERLRGEDLISYVRPAGRLDPLRLRQAFKGLLAGVCALHDAGFVHRDIAPNNVCVTADGRAVLLDFGLLARVHEARDAPVGNADYASPEQLEGSVPAVSSDIYALGGCLYHALSGRPPFEGANAAQVSMLKRSRKPRVLSTPGLRGLCAAALHMLEPHPAERPQLAQVVQLLAREEAAGTSRPPTLSVVPDVPVPVSFHGRSAELLHLTRASERARSCFTFVLVEGESGLGKSALVSEFAHRLERERPDVLVLASRCYENELLAFKAFDGVVDQLARALRALPQATCEELLPKKAALLAQLFPVLGSVPAIAKAPKKGLPADPTARRQLALTCFVELLERLSAQRPLLLLIDDLQWADVESLRLLGMLSSRASALPLLAIATARPRRDLSPELAAELSTLDVLPSTSSLALAQLTPEDLAALSASLLGPNADSALLRRLGEESKGHPLFLRELVEHAKSGAPSALVSLDDALQARMARFDAEARSLVALLALAGRPYSTQVFAAALGRVELPRESLNELLNQGLVRRRGEDGLTCYHDRIRHTALAGLSESERRELSVKLATALSTVSSCEDAERARLWDEAGRPQEAIPALEAAGNAALEKLAFQAAEQHYARALALIGSARDERWRRLTSQRGHALVRMGKNAEAARLYAAAAVGAGGELRVRLRIWAAQNLIQGAQVEEGLRAAGQLLAELGAPLAKSEAQAKSRILWESARLKLRGSELKPPRAAPASSERLLLDALNELSQPVASVMFLHGAALSVQHVRRALDAGDPAHAARALAYEGIVRSTRNPERDHSVLFARARELAQSTGDPAVIAAVEIRRGIACISLSDFEGGVESLLAGHELVSLQCPGQPWLITTARMYLGASWMYLGEHVKLAAETEIWARDAHQREDLYGYAALVGFGCGFLQKLMRDDPEAATAQLSEAMAPWPDEPFSTNHFGAAMGHALTLLYAGGARAQRWFEQNQPRFQRAAILRNPILQIGLGQHRIAACCAALPSLDHPSSHAILAIAQKQLRTLRKLPSLLGQATADYWSSVFLAFRGEREQALATARRAHRGLSALHHFNGIIALYWVGWLEAGESGREKCEQALAQLVARGWQAPERAVAMLLPVFHLLPAA